MVVEEAIESPTEMKCLVLTAAIYLYLCICTVQYMYMYIYTRE